MPVEGSPCHILSLCVRAVRTSVCVCVLACMCVGVRNVSVVSECGLCVSACVPGGVRFNFS